MSIGFVQKAQAQSVGAVVSLSTSGITTTSGNLLVLDWGTESNSITSDSTLSDSKSNTWNKALSATNLGAPVNQVLGQHYAFNVVGGASHTFTITPPVSAPCGIGVSEWSGVLTTNPLEVTNSAQTSSGTTPIDAGAVNPATASSLYILTGMVHTQNQTFSPAASWTMLTQLSTTSTGTAKIASAYLISSGSQDGHISVTVNDAWTAVVATYTPAAGAAPAIPRAPILVVPDSYIDEDW